MEIIDESPRLLTNGPYPEEELGQSSIRTSTRFQETTPSLRTSAESERWLADEMHEDRPPSTS